MSKTYTKLSNIKTMLILSGDIGGTNTRLQLTQFDPKKKPKIINDQSFKNVSFKRFEDIISTFLSDNNHKPADIAKAGFAFAGPIINRSVSLTNLPWTFSEVELQKTLGISAIHFINDFEAIAHGIKTLTSNDIVSLQTVKSPSNANMQAVIGAGTGLGIALIQTSNNTQKIIPTEGGHVDFAPTDKQQEELLCFMRNRLHRVSNERIVSGIGIVNIYKFVRANPKFSGVLDPSLHRLSLFSHEFAAEITHYAINKRDPVCLETLDIFIRCYGTITGNLALTTLPYGGLYITGGIAPKLLQFLEDGRFMDAFLDKGRMSYLLKKIPVHVVTNTNIGLTGAAYYAAKLTSDKETS